MTVNIFSECNCLRSKKVSIFLLLITSLMFCVVMIGTFHAITDNISEQDCELDIQRGDIPLVLDSTQINFIYPLSRDAILKISTGSTIILVCPGQSIQVDSSTFYSNITSASCVSGSDLNVDGITTAWENIKCTAAASREAKVTGSKCENNGTEIEIGFQIQDDLFLRVFLVCFNESSQQALYSKVVIPAAINQRVQSIPRPSWMQTVDIFSIKKPDSYYTRTIQRQNVNSLLGLPENSTQYIQSSNDYYLARGHMTAKADNFYPAQQNASFFLLNTAPQWQTCNDRNWKSVEESVRSYAEAKNATLLQWTGVYGVTTLPHNTTGESVALYLYNQNNTKALPIPELFWKVAYESKSQTGIVLIVVNNPYLDTYQPICEDIAEQISWINWSRNNQEKGFGYACTVDSFRKVVDYLPQFTVKDVLT